MKHSALFQWDGLGFYVSNFACISSVLRSNIWDGLVGEFLPVDTHVLGLDVAKLHFTVIFSVSWKNWFK